jgi:hypothetical protein
MAVRSKGSTSKVFMFDFFIPQIWQVHVSGVHRRADAMPQSCNAKRNVSMRMNGMDRMIHPSTRSLQPPVANAEPVSCITPLSGRAEGLKPRYHQRRAAANQQRLGGQMVTGAQLSMSLGLEWLLGSLKLMWAPTAQTELGRRSSSPLRSGWSVMRPAGSLERNSTPSMHRRSSKTFTGLSPGSRSTISENDCRRAAP